MKITSRLCATILGVAMPFIGFHRATAQDAAPLRVVRWSELHVQGTLPAGEVVEQDGPHAGVLKIEHAGPGPAVIQLAEIADPGVTAQQYALTGQIRYENVAGTGFLEMLSYLPDGSWFFSRTMGQVGPMQSLSGTSTWRDVQLPASLGTDPDVPRPNRLVLNLHLAGPGTVYLSDFTLSHLPDDWAATFGWGPGWWSNRAGGLIGGALGSLLGIIGAIVGTLCGLGRGRVVATALLVMMAAAGVVCLALGIVALVLGQPYAVYYPLLLIGVLAAVLGGVGIPVSRQRFAQAELRRMQALDAR